MFKICKGCGTNKLLTEFKKDNRVKSGYGARCKTCQNTYDSKYYHTVDKTKKLIRSRKYVENNPEKKKEMDLLYRQRRPEVGIKAREKYRQNNQHIYNKQSAKYRAMKLNATPTSTSEFYEFFMNEIYSLSRLRSELTGTGWHVDHIVPLNNANVCGLHVPANLRVIPAKENLLKSNKFIG